MLARTLSNRLTASMVTMLAIQRAISRLSLVPRMTTSEERSAYSQLQAACIQLARHFNNYTTSAANAF